MLATTITFTGTAELVDVAMTVGDWSEFKSSTVRPSSIFPSPSSLSRMIPLKFVMSFF